MLLPLLLLALIGTATATPAASTTTTLVLVGAATSLTLFYLRVGNSPVLALVDCCSPTHGIKCFDRNMPDLDSYKLDGRSSPIGRRACGSHSQLLSAVSHTDNQHLDRVA